MLPPLFARPPTDPTEERRTRRLAHARHAPASWLQRAPIITLSWDGAQVGQIAAQLGCHPRTAYRWLHRFNAGGIDDLGDLPRSGRPRRLSELDLNALRPRGDPPIPGVVARTGLGLRASPVSGADGVRVDAPAKRIPHHRPTKKRHRRCRRYVPTGERPQPQGANGGGRSRLRQKRPRGPPSGAVRRAQH
jgi:Winged helix-turn helix